MKVCSKCKEEKPIEDFYTNKGSKDKKLSFCKKCHFKKVKQWRKDNPEKHKLIRKRERMKYVYDLTLEQWDDMRKKQDNKCALCFEPFISLPDTDHDHKTGRVRGLLCHKHNQLLGFAEDSVEVLEQAIEYLKKNANGY